MHQYSRSPATRGLLAIALCTLASGLWAQKTPDEALRALQDGNRRFAADKSVPQPVGEGVRRTLARGQSPIAVVLCCADSRVPPEHVFNAGLGELFVVRVAGNTCDPETLASIEYAVEHLNVPLCVVLGHEGCGAVAAAVSQLEAELHDHPEAAASQAIQQLLERIEPAARKARARDLGGAELCAATEEEHVHTTVHECLRRSPLLRRFVQAGRFRMVGARYQLRSGTVDWLPTRPLPPEPQAKAERHRGAVPMSVPPHVALRLLQAGHRRFVGDGLPAGDLTAARREALAHGQRPLAIVLTCADSRIAPEHVFDAGLGELFVVRVAGNVLNDDVLASIEYAATHTGASLLVVMGHTRCGAITAAADHPEGQQLTGNLRSLLARLEPSVAKARTSGAAGQDLVELAARANVQRTVVEARTRSAILRDLEQQGRFAMLPALYDLGSGDLTWLKDVAEHAGEAAPPAAPAGEMAPPNGPGSGDAAPARDEHDDHGDAAKGHHDSPPAVSVLPEEHGKHPSTGPGPAQPAAHGASPAQPHGESRPHGGHGADPGHAGRGDSGASAPAEPHGATDPHAASTGPAAAWRDPIVLVGLGGVVSLLLAALVAVTRRS